MPAQKSVHPRQKLTPIQQTARRVKGLKPKGRDARIEEEIARLRKIKKYFHQRSLHEAMSDDRAEIKKINSDPVYSAMQKLFAYPSSEFWKRIIGVLEKNGVKPRDIFEAMHKIRQRKMRKVEYEKWVTLLGVKDEA